MEIKWPRKAIANLEAEFQYIAEEDPQAVERFVNKSGGLRNCSKSPPWTGKDEYLKPVSSFFITTLISFPIEYEITQFRFYECFIPTGACL